MAVQTSVLEEETLDQIHTAVSPVQPVNLQHESQLQHVQPLQTLDTSDELRYPSGARFWMTILSLCIVLILGGLDNNIVATAVPSITENFNTVADVGWYSSAFRLCTCAFQFMFGKMYKLFSIKRTFLFSNAIFLVGSLLCATAATSSMFVVGRAVTGMGFAGQLAGCFAMLVEIVPMQRRPIFSGLLACVESLAIIAAPIVGGLLTESLGWRWCFWINLPIGAVSIIAIISLFSDPAPRQEHDLRLAQKLDQLDFISNLLFIPSLTALFVALSWAGTKYPWSDGKVIGLLVVWAILLVAFFCEQFRRGDSAALPLRIISQRNVIAGFIFTGCTNSMMQVLEYYLPTYYQVVRGVSPSESGIKMIPILFGMMLGLLLQGIGTTTFGYYAPFMLFASICMPVAAGLMTTYSLTTGTAQTILYSGFAGFAGGVGFQGPQSAVQIAMDGPDVNLGIGVILFGQSFGPAVAVAIAQVIFTNQLVFNLSGLIPGLTPAALETSSLSSLLSGIPLQHKNEALAGIDHSLAQTWYLAVALGCTTIVGSLLVEWRSVKRKQS